MFNRKNDDKKKNDKGQDPNANQQNPPGRDGEKQPPADTSTTPPPEKTDIPSGASEPSGPVDGIPAEGADQNNAPAKPSLAATEAIEGTKDQENPGDGERSDSEQERSGESADDQGTENRGTMMKEEEQEVEMEQRLNGKISKPFKVENAEDPWRVRVHYNTHAKATDYPYLNEVSAKTAYERMHESLGQPGTEA